MARVLWWGMAVVALLGVIGCRPSASEQSTRPVTRIRLVTGPIGGGSLPLGEEIAAALNQGMKNVAIETVHSAGAVSNISAIQKGEAQLALTFADVAYLSFSGRLAPRDPPFDQVRGIAVLQVTPVGLVVRPGLHVREPQDLRGRRVGVGPEGSGTEVTANLILQAFGLGATDLHAVRIGFQEGVTKLLGGELDAMFDNAIIRSEALKRAAEGGARFVPIEGPAADRLRREYPFLTVTVIAPELYGTSVRTIGVDGLLICRSDLDEALVYELTRQLFVSLQSLRRGALRSMDVKQAPATPVPL
ncbi:MAG: TAXI family TRAP transporter solute-binding subunit, partial [Acidobacteria bacterium]